MFNIYAFCMFALSHRYCKVCHKETDHVSKSYFDGTIAQECMKCYHVVLNRKGHDHQRFEEAIKKKRSLVVAQKKNIEELRVRSR